MKWEKKTEYYLLSDKGWKISRAFVKGKQKFTLWQPDKKEHSYFRNAGTFRTTKDAKSKAECLK